MTSPGRGVATALALLVVGGCASAPAPSPDAVSAARERARAAADALFARLSGELAAAMQSGGPPAAVAVCRDRAPAIAAEIEAETGVDIERTAIRVRNPANAPDAWEREAMARFEQRREAGEAWSAMEVAQVETGTLRWMRPIAMGPMCVACHGGAEVAAETAQAIAAAYPQDAARGFAPGQLRGAFTARAPLDVP